MQRLFPGHLSRENQAREMRAALVVAELGRQPVAFVETREARLVVFVRSNVCQPNSSTSSCIACSLMYGTQFSGLTTRTPFDEAVVQLVREDVRQRECLQRPRSEPAVDVLQLAQVGGVIVPFQRLADALGRVVARRSGCT